MLRKIIGWSNFEGKSKAGNDFTNITLHTTYIDLEVAGTAVSTVSCFGPSKLYDVVHDSVVAYDLPFDANVDFDQRGRFCGFTPIQ